MKNTVLLVGMVLTCLIISCSQNKKLIRKASNAVERSDFDKAVSYYDQVLAKDSMNYYANAGKGVVLSEYMGKHGDAIPYLERAIKKNPEKTSLKLNYDLGKSYHFVGNYPRALFFYGKTAKYNKKESPDYDMFLNKRVADCKYAMEHPQIASPEEQSVVTAGSTINSTMPDYGAVYTHNKLIFTSKRKDDDKEKKNGLDGRYFEAMYVSYVSGDTYTTPRRYTVPDVRSNPNFSTPHESAISVSPDGITLYIYREGQIYETDLNDSTKSAHHLDNTINFSYLQSHATLSADGNTMIFASESERGVGGLDLYISVKNEKGNWSDAKLLDNEVNTIYNEDAPYLSPNGTLFFASNGLPGYGGYDIYKTKMVGNAWTKPENLGQPINSPGDDTYFALINNTSNGYYTSVRNGGMGDMDIYKVHYLLNEVPECNGKDTLLSLMGNKNGDNELVYTFSAQVPVAYAQKVKSISWKVNGVALPQTTDQLTYTFNSPGSYTITAKAAAYCDSCPTLMAFCSEKVMEIGTPMFASADSRNANTINENQTLAHAKKDASKKSKITGTKSGLTPASSELVLNDAQLKDLNWDSTPAYFDLNRSEVRDDVKAMLNQNIAALKKNKSLAVNIKGYADSRGSEQYNKNLSGQRANAIKRYLIENGIPQRRILSTLGFGETNLVNGCSDGVECDENQHQMNRRVQFEVINLVRTPTDITLN